MAKLITVGEVIDKSWHHYTKHFVELMSISGWLLVVAVLATISAWLYPPLSTGGIPQSLTTIEQVAIVIYIITIFIIAPIISVWIFNALVKLIDRQAKGSSVNLKTVGREGWKFFWPRVLVAIMVFLSLLVTILFVVPGVLLSSAAVSAQSLGLAAVGSVITFAGIIVATIGFVLISIKLFFSSYTLLLENKRGTNALKGSLDLTRNRWWATFWRVVIPKVVFFVAFFVVQAVLLFIIRTIILNAVGLNVMLGARIYSLSTTAIFFVLTIFFNPIILIADYHIFSSLRATRKKA